MMHAMLLLATPVAGVPLAPAPAKNSSSPWCQNPDAPAQPGMFGNMGSGIGLSGATHPGTDVFIDLPLKVAPLFNQGLGQIWGFNRQESCRNFETAAAMDPACALCQWGRAVCHGPNLQLTVGPQDMQVINDAARKAQAIAHQQPELTPKTKFLIAGVMALVDGGPDGPPYTLRKKYAAAMCAPMPGGEEDADVDAICGGALMSVSSWDYYTQPQNHGNFPLKPEVAPESAAPRCRRPRAARRPAPAGNPLPDPPARADQRASRVPLGGAGGGDQPLPGRSGQRGARPDTGASDAHARAPVSSVVVSCVRGVREPAC
jgi:hypothetical protein